MAMTKAPIENLLISLGSRIKQVRTEKELTQEELASKCGFDRTYISLLERGKRNISFSNLQTLALGLDITISDLTKDL